MVLLHQRSGCYQFCIWIKIQQPCLHAVVSYFAIFFFLELPDKEAFTNKKLEVILLQAKVNIAAQLSMLIMDLSFVLYEMGSGKSR